MISVRVTYSAITEESARNGDHSSNGFMSHALAEGYRQPDGDTPEQWQLRDALDFLRDKCDCIESCWLPGDDLTLIGTGNTGDCEDGEIEVCYDLHVKGLSDGSMHRLVKVLARRYRVYFANVQALRAARNASNG